MIQFCLASILLSIGLLNVTLFCGAGFLNGLIGGMSAFGLDPNALGSVSAIPLQAALMGLLQVVAG